MFENVREDIAVGAEWHNIGFVRRLFGEAGVRTAAVLLSPELQAVLLYRFQAWTRQHHIPIVPNICRRLTMMIASVSIGDYARIEPGLLIAHGNVVIDGHTYIRALCSISPFVTIGLNTGGPDASIQGPQIGRFVFIGTGAKILGPVKVGDNVRIGANAVVLDDIPDNHTAIGIPARALPHEGTLGATRRD